MSKDYIASVTVFALSVSIGLFLVIYNPTLFTYILGSLLILSGTIVLVLKHVFMCIDRPKPLDIV